MTFCPSSPSYSCRKKEQMTISVVICGQLEQESAIRDKKKKKCKSKAITGSEICCVVQLLTQQKSSRIAFLIAEKHRPSNNLDTQPTLVRREKVIRCRKFSVRLDI